MPPSPVIRRWSADVSPLDLLARWPADRPLVMLHAARPHPRWGRWSIAAAPRGFYRFDGRSRWIGSVPATLRDVTFTHDPLTDLDAILARCRVEVPSPTLPFVGGWIGYLSYDLGRIIEPAAAHVPGPRDDRGWPLVELAHCPDAIVHDHSTGSWWAVGAAPSLAPATCGAEPTPRLGPLRADISPEAHVEAVKRAIALIEAGDIYQANITQRLTARFRGSTRRWSRDALRRSGAWFGAYLELPDDRRLVSLSPELFLTLDPADRRVLTRPIKGTRRGDVDARELAESEKDTAELHMIVDLLRNDLGRVCRFGSVRVNQARRIETHPTVHHGVGEIEGRLRDGVTIGGLLASVFPGGSVTGVPKIRAMQIIDELEAVRRGPYCGSIGYFGNDGALALNIAIRTAVLTPDDEGGSWLDYGVGGGIVADSRPWAEYEETIDKARVLGMDVGVDASADS